MRTGKRLLTDTPAEATRAIRRRFSVKKNLIMREEECEMFPFCREENIAMTLYSALASGITFRVSKLG